MFYAESCRDSTSGNDESLASVEDAPAATLWVGSSTHSCSKVTILDGNSPQKILECFLLCSSHLLCSASVPGFSVEDVEVITTDQEQSSESSTQGTLFEF